MHSDISIRPVATGDIQEVIDLRIQASLEAYSAFDADQLKVWVQKRHSLKYVQDEAFGACPTLMLVAHQGTELVATAYAKISPQDHGSDAYIGGLYISSSFRRIGLGSRLIDQRLQWLRSQGVRQVLTEVERTNTPAMNLMSRYGFVERSVMPWEQHVPAMVWSVQTLTL